MLARSSARSRWLSLTGCVLAASMMLAGCADVAEAPIDAASGPSALVTEATSTTTSLVIVGEPVNRFSLGTGDCFNRYRIDNREVFARVGCDIAHDGEVYLMQSHPAPFGEPWPGEAELSKYAQRVCYEQFEGYVGIIYELSALGIGTFTPPQENWDDPAARYRGITCYLVNTSGTPIVGSMRQKGV